MRLRVKVKNAKECRIELNFPDLSVKYNNGWAPALRVAEGAEIPLDVLDPEDVRKSLKVGSLQGYLANGWIEEFTEEATTLLPMPQKTSQFISEKDMAVTPKQQDVPPQPILPEVNAIVQKPISVPQNDAITDFAKVFCYEDFCKLSHILKLRFIKETGNIELLNDILSKTPSSQFKNNINLRLSQSTK